MKNYSLLIQQYKNQDLKHTCLDEKNGSLQDANCSIDCDCPCFDGYYSCSDCFDCHNCSCCDNCSLCDNYYDCADCWDCSNCSCCDSTSDCGCCSFEMAICGFCEDCGCDECY